MFRSRNLTFICALIALAALAGSIGWFRGRVSRKPRLYRASGLVMGSFYTLEFSRPAGIPPEAAARHVRERLAELERRWSPYNPESEISRLNRTGRLAGVSPETRRLLELSAEISRRTGGAFDITVGPLIEAWRNAEKTGRPPDLKKLLPLVDYRRVRLTGTGEGRLERKGMRIDPGAIGKGLAVDEAVRILRRDGVPSGLVNLGGNLYAFGPGPDRGLWTIGIQDPFGPGEKGRLRIRDQGVSTSGTYQQWFQVGQKRFSHIVNPGNGELKSPPRSVTVLAPGAGLADGLSTALEVLGPEAGLALLESIPGTSALIIMDDGRVIRSRGLDWPGAGLP